MKDSKRDDLVREVLDRYVSDNFTAKGNQPECVIEELTIPHVLAYGISLREALHRQWSQTRP